jgi:hypothetical protein
MTVRGCGVKKSISGARTSSPPPMLEATLYSARSLPHALYFLKVYELSGPEVHGHALTCLRLDIRRA